MRDMWYRKGDDWAMVTASNDDEYAIAVYGEECEEFFGLGSSGDAAEFLKGQGYKG